MLTPEIGFQENDLDFHIKAFVACLAPSCDQFKFNGEGDLTFKGHFTQTSGHPDFTLHLEQPENSRPSKKIPAVDLRFSSLPIISNSNTEFFALQVQNYIKLNIETRLFLLEMDVAPSRFFPKLVKIEFDTEREILEFSLSTFDFAHGFGLRYDSVEQEIGFLIRSDLMRPYLDSVEVMVDPSRIELEMTGNELVDQWQTSEVRIFDHWLKFSTQGDRTGLNASLQYPSDAQIDWNNLREIIHLSMSVLEGMV